MKHLIALSIIFFSVFKLSAQGFNGSIEFKSYKEKDTSLNVYHVKGKLVKLDKYTKMTNVIEGSFIFDLAVGKIRFVNPKRKVWGEHISETAPVIRGHCEVSKGNGSKTVAGVKCHEYTVKNTEENTIITYWVAESKFDFFVPLIKLWNRKDKQSIYFNQIKDLPEGSMPLWSEEKQISDGKSITKLEVTKISNKTPDEASLSVPAGYTKFD
jgi:hypothetical protein